LRKSSKRFFGFKEENGVGGTEILEGFSPKRSSRLGASEIIFFSSPSHAPLQFSLLVIFSSGKIGSARQNHQSKSFKDLLNPHFG
jgi:hypothetical protein